MDGPYENFICLALVGMVISPSVTQPSDLHQALLILHNAMQVSIGYAVATPDADKAVRELQEAKKLDATFSCLTIRKVSQNEVWITHAQATR
jgi:hypothetical protein